MLENNSVFPTKIGLMFDYQFGGEDHKVAFDKLFGEDQPTTAQ